MRRETLILAVPVSPGAGAARTVENLRGPMEMEFTDIVTSVHAVEVSYNGTQFTEVVRISANCVIQLPMSPAKVRVNTVSLSSGTPGASLTMEAR